MPYSYNIYTGNGSTTQYPVAFPYIRKEHIVAYVDYTLTSAFTWVNDSTIQFNTAPGAGKRVEIRRLTPLPGNLVDYADGSTLVAADLDTSNLQHLYKEQEIDDDIKQSVYVDPTTGLPTASNQRITNVLDPIAAQDVATKNYVDTTTVASAGDTMTGPLAMSTNKITDLGDPTANQDAATKAYVDTTTVASAGDTMTGQLNMGSNKVVNLAEPTSSHDAATKNYVDTTTWNNTDETIDSTEPWVATDAVIGTTGATTNEMDLRHDTLVQTTTPIGTGWRVGKTWLQNDANKTLSVWNGSAWIGVASGGTFTTQPTVIYVDTINGNDADDGRRIINPKKTIKAAVAAANAGDIIKVAPGVYQESLPIDITVANLSIVGEAQRSCFIHPTPATETQIMFRCNSGTYIDGFTFAGLKATGARGTNAIDNDATYGLPANQGWVAGFLPGCVIRKSPYINNGTNFADSGIDNSNFNPNSTSNFSSNGGDLTSEPTGGGIIVDGSLPDVNSPLRSFVVNEFTQVCLDGPGLLVCNNGYAQAVSFFGLFCHYHAKALSGGQINMEVGTTDFGRYGLIADGKSTTPIFTATANGSASSGAVTFAINAPTTGAGWFGDANRPAINMLAQVTVSGTTYIYPILASSANGAGWNVTISRPNPSNRAENLGLSVGHASGATWSFFLRSMVSTASHTMEYAGSGCDYRALPENGGVPVESNEAISRNNGKVWLTSTDQNGKFKVGDTFVVDQQTGFVNLDPTSYGVNIVSDLTPELGGDLDVLSRRLYTSLANTDINLDANGSGLIKVAEYNLGRLPIVTQADIGTDPGQVPLNQYLGNLAFQNAEGVNLGTVSINQLGVGTSSPGGKIDVVSGTAYSDIGIRSTGGFVVRGDGRVDIGGSTGDNSLLQVRRSSGSSVTGLAQLTDANFSGNGIRIAAASAARVSIAATSSTSQLSFGNTLVSDQQLILDTATGRLLVGLTSANTNGGVLQLSGGLTFPAAQVASTDPNTLDDYEEGTWTATLHDAATGGNQSSTTGNGYYTKTGNLVSCFIEGFDNISTAGMTAGNMVHVSLPFAVGTLTNGIGSVQWNDTGAALAAGSTPYLTMGRSVTRAQIRIQSNQFSDATFNVSMLTTGSSDLRNFYIVYRA